MYEFAYLLIGGLRTKSRSTPFAASQYDLRARHVNILAESACCYAIGL